MTSTKTIISGREKNLEMEDVWGNVFTSAIYERCLRSGYLRVCWLCSSLCQRESGNDGTRAETNVVDKNSKTVWIKSGSRQEVAHEMYNLNLVS